MPHFDLEKLHVYKASLDFITLVSIIIENFPRGKAYLTDQLQRASSSVTLNIAEGAGEFSENEKVRFYRMARRSATECTGIIEICWRLQLIEETRYSEGRELLVRMVSMLTKMIRKLNPR